MKPIFILAAALMCGVVAFGQNIPQYHDTEIEASKEYVEGNAYQRDLLLYADMLGDTHPYFADASHRKALDRQAKKLYRECGTIDDVKEFKLTLAKLAASLGDGHTAIYYWAAPDRIFPVRFNFGVDGRVVVDL
mgnify:FL=1